jgi:hypothetical protein
MRDGVLPALAGTALLLTLSVACVKRAPPPPAAEIPVRVTINLHPQIRLDRDLDELTDRVASAAVRWIRETPQPRLPVDLDRPLEVAIRVDLTEDLQRLVVEEQVRLRHAKTWPLEVDRRREVPIGAQGVDLAATLSGGVRSALALLADMLGLFQQQDAQLVAMVRRNEADDDVRSLAVRILQERKSRGAVPDLLAVFPDAPEVLRLTLLDSLSTLATPEQLGSLLAEVDGRRVDEVTRALRAAAMIGGRDAREYAGWMAMGHPDERMRQTALEAYLQITESMPPEDVVQLGLADIR